MSSQILSALLKFAAVHPSVASHSSLHSFDVNILIVCKTAGGIRGGSAARSPLPTSPSPKYASNAVWYRSGARMLLNLEH